VSDFWGESDTFETCLLLSIPVGSWYHLGTQLRTRLHDGDVNLRHPPDRFQSCSSCGLKLSKLGGLCAMESGPLHLAGVPHMAVTSHAVEGLWKMNLKLEESSGG
jgi:hypothetical protein